MAGEVEGLCKLAGRHLRLSCTSAVKQVPCLHAAWAWLAATAPSIFNRSGRYRTLVDQDEAAGDGTPEKDTRQDANMCFGKVMVSLALGACAGLLVKIVVETYSVHTQVDILNTACPKAASLVPGQILQDVESTPECKKFTEALKAQQFHDNVPLVLFVGVFQILACGACAHTAAAMYTRRRHALAHPCSLPAAIQRSYVEVQLEKDADREEPQLYGLGFRPSTDGLECLVVETVRPGSLLSKWNRRTRRLSPEELVERELGDGLDDGHEPSASSTAPPTAPDPDHPQVLPGATIVAINAVHADIGRMQQQLAEPKVSLWLRPELGDHASEFHGMVFDDPDATPSASSARGLGTMPRADLEAGHTRTAGDQDATKPAGIDSGVINPTQIGRGDDGFAQAIEEVTDAMYEMTAPRVACLALEDEEPQILGRWCVCGLLVGWVTMLPVLLMQPHEGRPRQQLFRQYLLKPSLIVLPIWIAMWLLDSLEMLLEVEVIPPLIFFSVCHIVLPTVLLWFLFQMQLADETLVLEQRAERAKEASSSTATCCEDASPTIFKELLVANPVSITLIGANLALQIRVCAAFATPQTSRGELAKQQLQLLYSPIILLQVFYLYILFNIEWRDVPQMYGRCLQSVIAFPEFMLFWSLWFFCMIVATRYQRMDVALVQMQRQERAKEAFQKLEVSKRPDHSPQAEGGEATPGAAPALDVQHLVDCSEVYPSDWGLLLSA